jgi:hypothetical protein
VVVDKMPSKTTTNDIAQKALQTKIKRLEFEQLCLERQIKNLEKEVEEHISEVNLTTENNKNSLKSNS